MIWQKLHNKIRNYVQIIERYTDRIWYPPLIGFLAALDNLIVIVPTDGIAISSSMVTPKRWFTIALSISLGSTLGALVLAMLVEHQGLPWILSFYPGIAETKTWILSMRFFDSYGLLLVFVIAITPFMQQPAVILASLASTPIAKLAAVIFAGRFLKYLAMSYLASHAPRLLGKVWGLRGELKDAGVKID